MKDTNASQESLKTQLNDIAQDTIIFGNIDATSQRKDKLDSITDAIREEVISKQQDLLFSWIIKDLDKDDLRKEELEKDYLQNRSFPSQELVDKALKNKELQDEIYKIEKQGYRVINEKFKDQLKNLNWSSTQGSTQKSAEIKINDKVVCSLNQEIVRDKPFAAILSNGQVQEITSYRKINLPKHLNGSGPMHAMLAARDANGQAIAAKDAIYFSVHYDDSGKLSEVSAPIPIKFVGKGDEAIGYIEKDGQIYTLPVDQGTYKALMQEVSINKGIAKDISSIEIERVSNSPTIENKKENLRQEVPVLEIDKDRLSPQLSLKDKQIDMAPMSPQEPKALKQETINQHILSGPSNAGKHEWVSAKPSALNRGDNSDSKRAQQKQPNMTSDINTEDRHKWVSAKPSALNRGDNSDSKKTQTRNVSALVKNFGSELIQKLDQIRKKVIKFLPAVSGKRHATQAETLKVRSPSAIPNNISKTERPLRERS